MIFRPVAPEPDQRIPDPPERRVGRVGFALLALALGGISTILAYLAPEAPDSYLTDKVAIGVVVLVAATVAISAVARLVERRRGPTPDGEALALIKSCKAHFGTALATSLVGLAALLVTVRIFDGGGSDLFIRAWYILLFGGALLTLVAILLANIIFLVQSHQA